MPELKLVPLQITDEGELIRVLDKTKIAYKGDTIRKWCMEHMDLPVVKDIWNRYYSSKVKGLPLQREVYYNIFIDPNGSYIIKKDKDFENTKRKEVIYFMIVEDKLLYPVTNKTEIISYTGKELREWCNRIDTEEASCLFKKYFDIKNKSVRQPANNARYRICASPKDISNLRLERIRENLDTKKSLFPTVSDFRTLNEGKSVGFAAKEGSSDISIGGRLTFPITNIRSFVSYHSGHTFQTKEWADDIMYHTVGKGRDLECLNSSLHLYGYMGADDMLHVFQLIPKRVIDVVGNEIPDLYEVVVSENVSMEYTLHTKTETEKDQLIKSLYTGE